MSIDLKIINPGGAFSLGSHDIVLDSLGSVVLVSGQDKLIQDIQKILFTNINNFYPQYSTKLDSIIGTNLGKEETIDLLSRNIADSLVYLQFLQQEQATYQQIDASEQLKTIVGINVAVLYDSTKNPKDLTTYKCDIIIQNGANQVITTSRNVNVI